MDRIITKWTELEKIDRSGPNVKRLRFRLDALESRNSLKKQKGTIFSSHLQMAENPKEMENPEEVKLHSAFLADFGAIHQELMDQEAKTAQAEAAAAEMAETLKLELVLPITNMQEAKALSKLHEEYEFKGSVELLHQGLSMAERRELLEVAKAYMLKLSNWKKKKKRYGFEVNTVI